MRFGRWFLRESPDAIGLPRAQLAVTMEGGEAFAAWAAGDGAAAQALREAEPRGERAKREVLGAVRDAFITPRARGRVRPLERDRLDPRLRG